ncbi:MAG TPA: acyl-CoA dehydrogenase family protein, partial [Thermaerobacter sp.]
MQPSTSAAGGGGSPPAREEVFPLAGLDYYRVAELFSPEERLIQEEARRFLEAEAAPHIARWWEEGTFP